MLMLAQGVYSAKLVEMAWPFFRVNKKQEIQFTLIVSLIATKKDDFVHFQSH